MAPRSGPSLLQVDAAALQRMVADLECCGDTGVPAAQEGAPPPAAHGVAGYSSSDAPPQTGPRDDQDSEGLDMCGGEGSLGTPGERKGINNMPSNKLYFMQPQVYTGVRKDSITIPYKVIHQLSLVNLLHTRIEVSNYTTAWGHGYVPPAVDLPPDLCEGEEGEVTK